MEQIPSKVDLSLAYRILWRNGIGSDNGRRRLSTGPIVILQKELGCIESAAVEAVELLAASQILRFKRHVWEICRDAAEDETGHPRFLELRDIYRGRMHDDRLGTKAFIGVSTQAKEVRKLISLAADDGDVVTITGESGVGKSIVAELLHKLGPRKNEPFIRINCAALPEGVLESELFGHERGAFTSALSRHRGCFERAGRGTLFLDEIGEMPVTFQSKLLQVLEEGVFFRVGGEEEVHSDARIVVATNRNLISAVVKRDFRQDLFFRIYGIPILVPPLRERREDIEHLVAHYAVLLDQKVDKPYRLSDDGWAALLSSEHNWPGNVRELQAVMRMAQRLARYGLVGAEHVRVPQLEQFVQQ